jgi:3,4-dihydroxy 2-butanone 4-phosphate synthase/GTP cyclohydrolase II
MNKSQLIGVEEAIKELKAGKMLILCDSEERENEGDLICAAELVTPETVNFMAKYGRGLICVPMTEKRLTELDIPMMVTENTSPYNTAFTVSVEAKNGVTTGISAHDRAHTIKMLANENSKASDFVKPGHIFPLKAKNEGVLVRTGQTEGSIDLCKLAGLTPVSVICEIMSDDGTMARMPELINFSKKHNIKIITVEEIVKYRISRECLVSKSNEAILPTQYGEFRIIGFDVKYKSEHHVALIKGTWSKDEPVLVRVHSECLTGDAFGSLRCDCGPQLHTALSEIEKAGKGVLLYLRQEGRGIGMINKINAYCLQDKGLDTVDANLKLGFKDDQRDYGIGAQILRELGVKKLRLMTNNPRKLIGLNGFGLEITEVVPLKVGKNKFNEKYLNTKKERLGHNL